MSTDLHTLSGAYSLNALSAHEAEEFRTHLKVCPACRQEVAELQGVAARLGASEVIVPPASLKTRVLAAADREPQLPPLLDRPAEPQEIVGDSERPRSRWFPRLLAAAAALVAVVAGGVALDQATEPDQQSNQLATGVTRVFSAEDASTKTQRTSTGATVSVATSPSLNRMAVDTDELPALSDEQVYQLWAISGDTTQSRGVIADPSQGASMRMPGSGVQVAITVEPAGGSQQPTSDPIVSVVPSRV